jgi:hypothetical protein
MKAINAAARLTDDSRASDSRLTEPVVRLTLFGIDKTLATSFSVFVFLILPIPLWGIGLLAFAGLKLSLKKIRTAFHL